MEKTKSCYTDFKISARGSRLTNCLDTAANLGYGRVAVDLQVNLSSGGNKKINLPHVKELDDIISQATVPKGLEVMKRITISLDEGHLLHSVQSSSILNEYDITALHCTNEKVFQMAVSCISTDLISLEWGERLGYPIRHTQISQIIDKGTMFEVCYTPAIKDSTQRCNIISNIMELVSISKGKGIVFSSGAEQDIELRGPLDVINLCHLFNMKTEQCKATITTNCVQVISHIKQRKEIVKGAVSCHLLETVNRKRARNDSDGEDCSSDKKMLQE